MAICLLVVFSQFFLWPIAVESPLNQETAVIQGRVADAKTGLGLEGTQVYAESDADIQQTLTDSKGRFTFLSMLPGTYWFGASKYGYASASSFNEPKEISAGVEYTATVVLSTALK